MKLKIPLLSLLDDALLGESSLARPFGASAVGQRGAVPALASIVVRGRNGANLIESHNAEEHDGTFFGRVTIGDWTGLSRTFSIHNAGTAPLKLGCTGLEGTGADQFEITGFPEPVVAPGGSTTLTIRYRGRQAGSAVALVLIPTNDPTERPYLFLIEGEASYA